MIRRPDLLEEFEDDLVRKTPSNHMQSLRIVEALYEEARQLGAFPPEDPLEGIEVDVRSPGPSMFSLLLERIAHGLDAARIPYMVIGGQAVLLYGEPRLTKDIDLTLDAGLERLPEVLDVARGLGFQTLVDPETFPQETMVLPCQDPASGIRIDFSFSVYEQQAIARSVPVRMGGAQVRFASLEDLIVHKVVAGRPRDLEDIRILLLKHPAVDAVYLERWLSEFAGVLGEPLVDRFQNLRPKLR